MDTIWSKESDAILKVGRSLEDVGVYNWALTKTEALMALDRLEAEGIAILGGDVYVMQIDSLQSNYDNWYCDRDENESTLAFVSRSIAKAREYVTNYKLSRDAEYYFAIVPEC
ncbi:Immunity protein 40 [Desulfomicrobium apsheronum]|uniref:Immunity protein 40 n=1 Tax=Desulfomicrobium apsheronum TaxID=52560 RepID=A0A1I3NEL3_9BACT|nr:Imm40 family immunity protein [Desulfomicrobium apsheronum]SFJ07622.1 Immunity protein 40 [Desulfomicrobium apsheronum]